ncbi:TPA: nucleotidyl transferase AbiEii/AbiGii toxin family protein [Candidatus Ventrenecus stercoripullorum]|nr:nucleotidyl transferase AbiEii/AbiGii toxin family protein [Candidatus Ventrenecus stercoripullorum]
MIDVIDAEDLKIKIKTKAHENHLEPQDIMQMYFFERLLYRIGISKYKYNFILKGGLLLSAIFGDERRTTQDMDTMLKGIPLEAKTLEKIIKEIISIDDKDGITFEIVNIKDIRLIDKYGGLKVKLIGYKEHLRVPLAIDVTVGDPITPKELKFKYKCMFDDSYINIMAFNKETIIAEKFETFITDNIMNTRAKDFYDLYILLTKFYNDINKDDLVQAIKNTFERRASKFDINMIFSNFYLIKNSERLKTNFNRYKLKKIYVKDISYEDVMDAIEIIIKLLQKELTPVF